MRNMSASKVPWRLDLRALGAILGVTTALSCGEVEPSKSADESALLAAQAARSIRVRATGTGCPSNGTWDARVRDGGARIEVTFSRFSANLEPSDREVLRSCELQVSLASGETVTYAPAAIEVSGRADAVTLSTGIWWAGTPEARRTTSSSLESEFYENYDVDGLVSPCGVSQDLRVSLEARVPKGSFKLDGAAITLTRQRCEPAQDGGADAGLAGDAAVDLPDAGSDAETGPVVNDGGVGNGPAEIGTPTARGPGCGTATVAAPARPDGTGLTLRFSGFVVQRGESASADINCNIAIPVGSTARQTYGIASVTVRGNASLQQDMEGFVISVPRIQGIGPLGEAREIFSGPTSGAFSFSKTFTGNALGFVPCGTSRTLQLALSTAILDKVEAAGRAGTLDISELSIDFATRACPN
jgi:hypothetical protein